MLSDDDTIYIALNGFFQHFYPLYFNFKVIGKVGVGMEESVLSVKLRTQEQTGVPVSNISILRQIPRRPLFASAILDGPPRTNEVDRPITYSVYGDYRHSSLEDNDKVRGNNRCYIEIV